MKRDAAALLVAQRLGGNRTDLTDRILSEFLLCQERYENEAFVPWFCYKDRTLDPALLSGEHSVVLPPDFIRFDEEMDGIYHQPVAGGRWVKVKVRTWQEANETYPQGATNTDAGITPGCPKFAALRETTLEFFPTAGQDYPIRLFYYAKQAVLESNVENTWLKHATDLFVADTCIALSQHIVSEESNVGMFQQEVKRAWARLHTATEARLHSARDYELGGDDDD